MLATILSTSARLLAAGQTEVVAAQIGTIDVVSHEVFDETSEGRWSPYRIANKLHSRTREHVLERELLFRSGDVLDLELLAQTERNLRALPFVRDARVETTSVDRDGDGVPERVDVRVTTWDTWSLVPVMHFRQIDDRTLWQAGIRHKNLLGFGKEITFSHRQNLDRTLDQMSYLDPQLAGTRFTLTASAANLSDGEQGFLALGRPYYSLSDVWSMSLRAGTFRRREPLFADGVEVGAIPRRGRWGDIEFGRAVRRRQTDALRLHVAYRSRFDRLGDVEREFGIVEVGIRSIEHRYRRLTHVNRFERAEDFNLGAQSYATLGVSSPALGGGGGAVLFTGAGHTRGLAFRTDHFLIVGAGVTARHQEGRWANLIAEVETRYLLKSSPRRVLVGKAEFRHGHNLDPEVQILLGANSGLRGYPVRRFAGTRSLLLSAEERWFIADDLLQLVSVGVAAFIDSGFVWNEDEAVDLSDLKTAIGGSLLLGSNRLSSRGGARFDVGYALNRVTNTGRWVLVAGSEIGF